MRLSLPLLPIAFLAASLSPQRMPSPPHPRAPNVAMRHGYLITPAGITFGLTDPETRNFIFVKITPAITLGVASPTSIVSTAASNKRLSSRPEAAGRTG